MTSFTQRAGGLSDHIMKNPFLSKSWPLSTWQGDMIHFCTTICPIKAFNLQHFESVAASCDISCGIVGYHLTKWYRQHIMVFVHPQNRALSFEGYIHTTSDCSGGDSCLRDTCCGPSVQNLVRHCLMCHAKSTLVRLWAKRCTWICLSQYF